MSSSAPVNWPVEADGTLPAWLAATFRDRVGTSVRFRTEYRTFAWSYGRLWQSAHQAAGLYLAQGIRPGDRVMLWGPNSPNYAALLLGCFLSGVIAVPIDVRSQVDFLQRVQSETQARLLLRTRFRPDPDLPVPTIFLEDLEARLDSTSVPRSLPSPRPDDLAEILYTSGTTARPKGTMLTHANLISELETLQGLVDPIVRAGPLTLLSILPLSHVFEQVIGFLLALRVGATIVYLETVKPSTIADALRHQGITATLVVPRFLELLRDEVRRGVPKPLAGVPDTLSELGLRLPWRERRTLAGPIRHAVAPNLRYLICGGAPLDPNLERFWDGLGVLVLQGYGLTETSSAVTLNLPAAYRIGTVGRVLPNQAVRIGSDDEIQVKGPNITPGYYHRPDTTRAAFLDGWFRTGDAGRFDPAGSLIVKGRIKDVIVTSAGMKVYPEDVEAVLDDVSGVRASAVVEWKDHVHAVLLLAPEAQSRASHIVAAANRHLSSSQQILGYTVWPAPDLPRTATGKVRPAAVLAALPEIEAHRPLALPLPTDRISGLVAQVAHRSPGQIRPSDALGPDLGIDSISRMELLTRIEEDLGVDIDEEAVTADTTIGDLERMVAEHRSASGHAGLPHWSRGPVARALRDVLQRHLIFPFVDLFVDLEVSDCQNLAELRGPVIFAANHTSRLDTPIILRALPGRYRSKLCPAVRGEYFEAPGRPLDQLLLRSLFDLVALVFDAFEIPQYHGFRPSLRYAGELVDHGYSILVFPEGRQIATGQIGEFKEGIGILASALRVPVVPVRLTGLAAIASGGTLIPTHRGRATVRFGAPLVFGAEPYRVIADRVEAAVRDLGRDP